MLHFSRDLHHTRYHWKWWEKETTTAKEEAWRGRRQTQRRLGPDFGRARAHLGDPPEREHAHEGYAETEEIPRQSAHTGV